MPGGNDAERAVGRLHSCFRNRAPKTFLIASQHANLRVSLPQLGSPYQMRKGQWPHWSERITQRLDTARLRRTDQGLINGWKNVGVLVGIKVRDCNARS